MTEDKQNIENEYVINISNSILSNKKLSDSAIVAYIGIRLSTSKHLKSVVINGDILFEHLTKGSSPKKKTIDNLNEGILELIENGLIQVSTKTRSYYILKSNYMINDIKGYTGIRYSEISTIMNDTFKSRISLLRYFCIIVSRFIYVKNIETGFQNKVHADLTQEQIKEYSNVSSRTTIKTYNDKLVEMKLLYIHCFNGMSYNNRNLNNLYGRYENMRSVKDKADYKLGLSTSTLDSSGDNNKTNSNRSLAQIYNNIKKGKDYPTNKKKECYKYILSRNTYFTDMISYPDISDELKKEYSEKICDLSCFSNESFYKESEVIQ